jgi:hypothetical protein
VRPAPARTPPPAAARTWRTDRRSSRPTACRSRARRATLVGSRPPRGAASPASRQARPDRRQLLPRPPGERDPGPGGACAARCAAVNAPDEPGWRRTRRGRSPAGCPAPSHPGPLPLSPAPRPAAESAYTLREGSSEHSPRRRSCSSTCRLNCEDAPSSLVIGCRHRALLGNVSGKQVGNAVDHPARRWPSSAPVLLLGRGVGEAHCSSTRLGPARPAERQHCTAPPGGSGREGRDALESRWCTDQVPQQLGPRSASRHGSTPRRPCGGGSPRSSGDSPAPLPQARSHTAHSTATGTQASSDRELVADEALFRRLHPAPAGKEGTSSHVHWSRHGPTALKALRQSLTGEALGIAGFNTFPCQSSTGTCSARRPGETASELGRCGFDLTRRPRRLPSSGAGSGTNLARARRPGRPGDLRAKETGGTSMIMNRHMRRMVDGQLPAVAVSRPRHIPAPVPSPPTTQRDGSLLSWGSSRRRAVSPGPVTRSASPGGRRRPGAAPSHSQISPPTTDRPIRCRRDPGQG